MGARAKNAAAFARVVRRMPQPGLWHALWLRNGVSSCDARPLTLVETMIVIAIISLLAAIALPSFLRARRRSQDSLFVNELRVATSAFQLYAAENNGYPPNTTAGHAAGGHEQLFRSHFRFQCADSAGRHLGLGESKNREFHRRLRR